MNIVPTRIQEQINHVDRTRSLVIGISAGVTALWCIYRLFWTFYLAATLSSVGWSPVSLVFPFVLWGVIGVVAVIPAIAFLTRYAKQP
jgi:predicted peptidase